jgi:N-methylhydantoinase A
MSTSQFSPRPIRAGVDVGGTFTDVVVADSNGQIHTFKLPSTPADFSEGVVGGVREVLDSRQIDPVLIQDVIHGSTVATNAILERKGARTGLLTTTGFRDVLELRRLRMPRLYDMTWKKPVPLIERSLRLEIIERVDVAGNVVEVIDVDDARRKIDQLVAAGVESIAVCLIHSYANPDHEMLIGDILKAEYPRIWVSLSHRVLPVIREYERTSTTVINAYVQPTVASYFRSLREKLNSMRVSAPLLIMQSNGGVMDSEAASERPAYIVESGPAAGVIASAALARELDLKNVITFDMGGTTAKASLVEDGEPHFTAEFEVASSMSTGSRLSSGGGYALSVPFIDLAEVGAGGGSIIWLDPAGVPKVGPRSAGAVPGPICYGNGGLQPTVTDANLILGYLNPGGLLNGEMPLDLDTTISSFKNEISDRLGMDVLEAAFGSHELANASMIRAIKSVSVQRGRDPRDFTLVAFGGSGPVHATSIARELGIKQVLIPPNPGVFSAVGLLRARLEFHAKKTYLRRTALLTRDELEQQIDELEEDARSGIGLTRLESGPFEFDPWVEMRYIGQGFELPVRLPARGDNWPEWLARLEEDFGRQHELTYGHRTNNSTEVVHIRVVARETTQPRPPEDTREQRLIDTPLKRDAFFGERFGLLATRVVRREDLPTTAETGPCIVEDYDATTVVPPDYSVHRDQSWNIVIEEVA